MRKTQSRYSKYRQGKVPSFTGKVPNYEDLIFLLPDVSHNNSCKYKVVRYQDLKLQFFEEETIAL